MVWDKTDRPRRKIGENYINEHNVDYFMQVVDNIVLFEPTCELDLSGWVKKVEIKHKCLAEDEKST